MSTEITSYTTNEEVTSINEYYVNGDGSVNYDAIAEAIKTGDEVNFNTEDLICAYLQGTGALPDFMMSPESYLGSPDDYPWLWETEVVESLQQLGDLYGNNNGVFDEGDLASVQNFLTWGGVTTSTTESGESSESGESDESTIDQIEDYLESEGIDEETSEDTAEEVYNLFNVNDLSEVMSLFISMGNPGIALLMYVAYGLSGATRELQEAAKGVMEESNEEMEDLLDELQDIDPEDISAQYDSQAISQQLGVITTVLSTMGEFIQNAQDVLDQMIELASNLSEQSTNTLRTVNRNIG